jgi:antitoxin ParD1/3/4
MPRLACSALTPHRAGVVLDQGPPVPLHESQPWVGRMIKSHVLLETAVRSTKQFSITLPNEMADAVRAKVASGEYATESEVIRDGLRVLLARDQAVDAWLRTEVAAAYDALRAAPGRAVSAAKVRERLAAAQRRVSGKA